MKFNSKTYNELFHPIPDTVAPEVDAHVEKPAKKTRKKATKKEPEKKVEEVEEVEEIEEEPEAKGDEVPRRKRANART
jgi:uncharacterized protein YaaN involved in tellurite resistance